MSSEKTPNLQLHRWQPSDYVLRTEFNDNFAKIDDHAKQVTEQLAQTVQDVEDVGYNIRWNALDALSGDWSNAIKKALETVKNSSTVKKLIIPSGTFEISSKIVLDSTHNGITIEGNGFNSVIKMKDGSTTNWMFEIDDEVNIIEGLTIKNLQLDGNRDNLSVTDTTGFGIFIKQTERLNVAENRNIFLENLWIHDFLTTGLNIFSSGVMANNIFSYNNGKHGVAVDNCRDVMITNVNCYDNDGYGIDIGSGEVTLDNFLCRRNLLGGMKTSVREPIVNLRATNGRLLENVGFGFQTTESHGATYFFDNIEASDNGEGGFVVREGVNCVIGKLIARGNNKLTSNYNAESVSFRIPTQVDSLIIEENRGLGLLATSADIKYLKVEKCTNYGLVSYTNNKIRVYSGRIFNNSLESGTSQVAVMNPTASVELHNVLVGDDGETKKGGVWLSSGSSFVAKNCDFTSVSNTKITDMGATHLVLQDNKGFVTNNSGQVAFSGDGDKTVFTIPHKLNMKPTYANVTPSSTDATGNFSVSVDNTNITVTYASAPETGTDNIVLYFSAEYKKAVAE